MEGGLQLDENVAVRFPKGSEVILASEIPPLHLEFDGPHSHLASGWSSHRVLFQICIARRRADHS